MGGWFSFLFGEKDEALVEEIAKLHKIDKEIVKKEYKVMLERVKDEVQK